MDRRFTRAAWVCLLGVLLSGCGTVYRITKVTPATTATPAVAEKQEGVLYYAKLGVCRHETKYEEPIFDVTVTDPTSKAVVIQRSLGLKAFQNFKPKMAGPPAAVIKALGEVTDYQPVDLRQAGLIDGDNLALIANRSLPDSIVDYQHQYFYNVRQPISGSSTASIKIAADGTMSEASATVQSDTLKTVLSAVPTQALVALARAPEGGPPTYTISVTQRSFVWTLSESPKPGADNPQALSCPAPGAPLDLKAAAQGELNVTRELTAPADAKPAPAAAPAAPKPN